MAVDDHLLVVTSVPPTSASSSSSSPSITERRRFMQVATDNSSAFIQFLTNSRQSLLFVPTHRSRTNLSTTPSHLTKDTHSASNKSKSSNGPSLSFTSTDHGRTHSEQRSNPILNNPLLNHRKEQPKSPPLKISTDFSYTRLYLSSKPLKPISTNRANTVPLLANQTESIISDKKIIPDDNKNIDQEEIPGLNKIKYDYITHWLNEVHQATYSKTKRSKKRLLQS
jgi:hypothetical protein